MVERCAKDGYLITSGEPLFLQPGNRDHIRVKVETAGPQAARAVAISIATAMVEACGSSELLFAP